MNLIDQLPLYKLYQEVPWQHLRALHQLRTIGETYIKIHDSPYCQHLVSKGLLDRKRPSADRTWRADEQRFNQEYDLKIGLLYQEAKQFLDAYDLDKAQARFTLAEIMGLQRIYTQCDILVKEERSRGYISSTFLGSSKLLKHSEALDRVVLRILSLEKYPQLDNILDRALMISGCPRGRRIVLCENDAYLRQPDKAEALRTALWYAGGNNIAKLQHSPDPDLAFYYSCDWDHHGLLIYARLRKMYEMRGYRLQLLTPVAVTKEKRKKVGSLNHNSKWDKAHWKTHLQGDDSEDSLFTLPQQRLISSLIAANEWIEEESNDLAELLLANNVLVD
ncbi:hypothetical protein Q5H93_06340 [Hymenobacter sp. ASUV-10]|uniref:Wadjet protein JetD C-terminal domain-containing protein n=1 Tax=Hymenobacter aranciens TaxID=3063996 RepID=A0ABT9B9E0_9BACT|nr:hypothetical protein [Hymenobacter sp. ASUV-10]MDO7874344.1 hypothetical protein [Hymenobacter sp. ASUV-10]